MLLQFFQKFFQKKAHLRGLLTKIDGSHGKESSLKGLPCINGTVSIDSQYEVQEQSLETAKKVEERELRVNQNTHDNKVEAWRNQIEGQLNNKAIVSAFDRDVVQSLKHKLIQKKENARFNLIVSEQMNAIGKARSHESIMSRFGKYSKARNTINELNKLKYLAGLSHDELENYVKEFDLRGLAVKGGQTLVPSLWLYLPIVLFCLTFIISVPLYFVGQGSKAVCKQKGSYEYHENLQKINPKRWFLLKFVTSPLFMFFTGGLFYIAFKFHQVFHYCFSHISKRSELKENYVKLENETVDRIIDEVCRIDCQKDDDKKFEADDGRLYKEFRALKPAWYRLVSSITGGAGDISDFVEERRNYFKKGNAFPSIYTTIHAYWTKFTLVFIGTQGNEYYQQIERDCNNTIARRKVYNQLRDQVNAWSRGIQPNINKFHPFALHKNPLTLLLHGLWNFPGMLRRWAKRHGKDLGSGKADDVNLESGGATEPGKDVILPDSQVDSSFISWKENYNRWQELSPIARFATAAIVHESIGIRQLRSLVKYLPSTAPCPNLECKHADFAMIDEGMSNRMRDPKDGMVKLDRRVASRFVNDTIALIRRGKKVQFDKQKAINLLYQILYQYPEMYTRFVNLNEPLASSSLFPLPKLFGDFLSRQMASLVSENKEAALLKKMYHEPYEFLSELQSQVCDPIGSPEESLHNKLLSPWIERQIVLIHDIERIMLEIAAFLDAVNKDSVFINGKEVKKSEVNIKALKQDKRKNNVANFAKAHVVVTKNVPQVSAKYKNKQHYRRNRRAPVDDKALRNSLVSTLTEHKFSISLAPDSSSYLFEELDFSSVLVRSEDLEPFSEINEGWEFPATSQPQELRQTWSDMHNLDFNYRNAFLKSLRDGRAELKNQFDQLDAKFYVQFEDYFKSLHHNVQINKKEFNHAVQRALKDNLHMLNYGSNKLSLPHYLIAQRLPSVVLAFDPMLVKEDHFHVDMNQIVTSYTSSAEMSSGEKRDKLFAHYKKSCLDYNQNTFESELAGILLRAHRESNKQRAQNDKNECILIQEFLFRSLTMLITKYTEANSDDRKTVEAFIKLVKRPQYDKDAVTVYNDIFRLVKNRVAVDEEEAQKTQSMHYVQRLIVKLPTADLSFNGWPHCQVDEYAAYLLTDELEDNAQNFDKSKAFKASDISTIPDEIKFPNDASFSDFKKAWSTLLNETEFTDQFLVKRFYFLHLGDKTRLKDCFKRFPCDRYFIEQLDDWLLTEISDEPGNTHRYKHLIAVKTYVDYTKKEWWPTYRPNSLDIPQSYFTRLNSIDNISPAALQELKQSHPVNVSFAKDSPMPGITAKTLNNGVGSIALIESVRIVGEFENLVNTTVYGLENGEKLGAKDHLPKTILLGARPFVSLADDHVNEVKLVLSVCGSRPLEEDVRTTLKSLLGADASRFEKLYKVLFEYDENDQGYLKAWKEYRDLLRGSLQRDAESNSTDSSGFVETINNHLGETTLKRFDDLQAKLKACFDPYVWKEYKGILLKRCHPDKYPNNQALQAQLTNIFTHVTGHLKANGSTGDYTFNPYLLYLYKVAHPVSDKERLSGDCVFSVSTDLTPKYFAIARQIVLFFEDRFSLDQSDSNKDLFDVQLRCLADLVLKVATTDKPKFMKALVKYSLLSGNMRHMTSLVESSQYHHLESNIIKRTIAEGFVSAAQELRGLFEQTSPDLNRVLSRACFLLEWMSHNLATSMGKKDLFEIVTAINSVGLFDLGRLSGLNSFKDKQFSGMVKHLVGSIKHPNLTARNYTVDKQYKHSNDRKTENYLAAFMGVYYRSHCIRYNEESGELTSFSHVYTSENWSDLAKLLVCPTSPHQEYLILSEASGAYHCHGTLLNALVQSDSGDNQSYKKVPFVLALLQQLNTIRCLHEVDVADQNGLELNYNLRDSDVLNISAQAIRSWSLFGQDHKQALLASPDSKPWWKLWRKDGFESAREVFGDHNTKADAFVNKANANLSMDNSDEFNHDLIQAVILYQTYANKPIAKLLVAYAEKCGVKKEGDRFISFSKTFLTIPRAKIALKDESSTQLFDHFKLSFNGTPKTQGDFELPKYDALVVFLEYMSYAFFTSKQSEAEAFIAQVLGYCLVPRHINILFKSPTYKQLSKLFMIDNIVANQKVLNNAADYVMRHHDANDTTKTDFTKHAYQALIHMINLDQELRDKTECKVDLLTMKPWMNYTKYLFVYFFVCSGNRFGDDNRIPVYSEGSKGEKYKLVNGIVQVSCSKDGDKSQTHDYRPLYDLLSRLSEKLDPKDITLALIQSMRGRNYSEPLDNDNNPIQTINPYSFDLAFAFMTRVHSDQVGETEPRYNLARNLILIATIDRLLSFLKIGLKFGNYRINRELLEKTRCDDEDLKRLLRTRRLRTNDFPEMNVHNIYQWAQKNDFMNWLKTASNDLQSDNILNQNWTFNDDIVRSTSKDLGFGYDLQGIQSEVRAFVKEILLPDGSSKPIWQKDGVFDNTPIQHVLLYLMPAIIENNDNFIQAQWNSWAVVQCQPKASKTKSSPLAIAGHVDTGSNDLKAFLEAIPPIVRYSKDKNNINFIAICSTLFSGQKEKASLLDKFLGLTRLPEGVQQDQLFGKDKDGKAIDVNEDVIYLRTRTDLSAYATDPYNPPNQQLLEAYREKFVRLGGLLQELHSCLGYAEPRIAGDLFTSKPASQLGEQNAKSAAGLFAKYGFLYYSTDFLPAFNEALRQTLPSDGANEKRYHEFESVKDFWENFFDETCQLKRRQRKNEQNQSGTPEDQGTKPKPKPKAKGKAQGRALLSNTLRTFGRQKKSKNTSRALCQARFFVGDQVNDAKDQQQLTPNPS